MRPFAPLLLAPLLATPVLAQDAARGEDIYMRHCAVCHGIEATGGGPMAAVLLLQPTDLTMLSSGNEGTFPTIRVVMRIDGRDPLVSHGSPMPLFGQLYDEQDTPIRAPDGTPILTSQAIADLVAWLETVQR
ncbi:MAG: c-type cytochrome [Gemmobacter sp.]